MLRRHYGRDISRQTCKSRAKFTSWLTKHPPRAAVRSPIILFPFWLYMQENVLEHLWELLTYLFLCESE